MSENPNEPISLNLTDEEFVSLHAAASAKGLEVNDFIVATLREHTRMMMGIEAEQREAAAGPAEGTVVPSPS